MNCECGIVKCHRDQDMTLATVRWAPHRIGWVAPNPCTGLIVCWLNSLTGGVRWTSGGVATADCLRLPGGAKGTERSPVQAVREIGAEGYESKTIRREIHRMCKPCAPEAVLLGMLLCLAGIGAQAQDTSQTTKTLEVVACDNSPLADKDTIRICKEDLKALQPGGLGRFDRGFQYIFQRAEQPRSVVVGSGSATEIVQNPEHYLNQHSLTFDFSEVFPPSSDFGTMVSRVYASKLAALESSGKQVKKVQLDQALCKDPDSVITCLAEGTKGWKRAVSGLKVTGSLSERQGVQQGVLVPEGSFSNHYQLSGEVDFDPAQMFITGTNWKDAMALLQKAGIRPDQLYDDCANLEMDGKAQPVSTMDHRRCVAFYSRSRFAASNPPSRRDEILAAFIPKFQFKRMSQFDFVKSSGILIPGPYPESALNSYTVTWDLTRAIAATKTRLDADTAIDAFKQPRPGVKAETAADGSNQTQSGGDPKLCITYSGTSGSSISVPSTFSADSCYRFAKKMSASRYALACVSSNDVIIGPPIDAAIAPDDIAKPDLNSCRW